MLRIAVDGGNPAPATYGETTIFLTGFQNLSGGCLGFLNHQPMVNPGKLTWNVHHGCWTPKIGVKPPKWMVKIMENPINPWMIWGENPTIFGNIQMKVWFRWCRSASSRGLVRISKVPFFFAWWCIAPVESVKRSPLKTNERLTL